MSEKENNNFNTDVLVVGAGPVGLFAVFQCGMMNIKCHVVDSLDFIGGQCTALYPEKPIYDIPAHQSITGEELIDNLSKQAESFNPTYHLGEQLISLKKDKNGYFHTETNNGKKISAKAVIIAAGCGSFGPNKPPLKNLNEFEEKKSVCYLVRSKEKYRDKNVVIAGGGDSAVDWTIALSNIARNVYLIHRREKFRCAPENSNKLKQLAKDGKIQLIIPYQLEELKGKNGILDTVILKNLDGALKEIKADYLLPFYGLAMELGPIAEWGLNLDKKHIKVKQSTCETNIPGIYAIGDINIYENKKKLILCGFSEAAMAAHDIYNIIYPDQAYHFEYSTTKGVPK